MITHFVFDGVADGPLGVALEIISTAARLARSGLVNVPEKPLTQRVVSIDGNPVRTGAGRTFVVDGALRRVGAADILILPGLSAATAAEINVLLERQDIIQGIEIIARASRKGAIVAASCSATFVLASSGALSGKQATTTWWLGSLFAKHFPSVTLRADCMVVEENNVFTAGSAFAHTDLMLSIIARKFSPSLAHLITRYLVLDKRPSQTRYMVMEHLRSTEPMIRQLEAFISSNMERQLSLEEMAHATGTSQRTLARRVEKALGTTPQHFVQRLRVNRAVHLIETTQLSIDAIAASVGYTDPAAFRKIFRRETGEAPSMLRSRSYPQERSLSEES